MPADWDLFVDGDLPRWYADAACQDHPTDWWFPEQGTTAERAVDVCQSCPVRAACLAYALDHGFTEGVWGGKGPRARQRLTRERHAA